MQKTASLVIALVAVAAVLGSDLAPGGSAPRKAEGRKRGISPAVLLPVQSTETKDLAAGKLLVASRNLGDPNFAQTVVLLIQYDAQGVVGLVLNRRTELPLSRVLEGLEAAKERTDPAYLGGPVETPKVFALLRSPAKVEGAEHVFDGVYLIPTESVFEKTMSARPDPGVLRVYLGYAGWNREQLQMEVELGSWFIFPGDAKAVFDRDPESLWSRMIHKTELELAESGADRWQPATGSFASCFLGGARVQCR